MGVRIRRFALPQGNQQITLLAQTRIYSKSRHVEQPLYSQFSKANAASLEDFEISYVEARIQVRR
jgi:hypothetical protein